MIEMSDCGFISNPLGDDTPTPLCPHCAMESDRPEGEPCSDCEKDEHPGTQAG